MYKAQSEGLQKLISSFGGDTQSLIQYLMLDKGLYEKLATANASAIKGASLPFSICVDRLGLNPKITVWNTTSGDAGAQGGNGYADTVANVLKMLPPVLTTIHDQTGIKPGSWLAQGLGDAPKKDTSPLVKE